MLLSNYDLSFHDKLVDKYITQSSQGVFSHQVHSEYDKGVDPDILQLVDRAKELWRGKVVDKPRFMVELWSYRCCGDLVSSPLCMHRDDYGGVEFKVETTIFYTKFDKELEGGELEIRGKKTLKISEGDILLLGGDIWHKPLAVKGNGVRNCIVVQLESLR